MKKHDPPKARTKPALKPTTWPVIDMVTKTARSVNASKQIALIGMQMAFDNAQKAAHRNNYEEVYYAVCTAFEYAWFMRGEKGGPR